MFITDKNFVAICFFQKIGLKQPYDNCSTNAEPVSHCVANCSTVKAENSCHCKDIFPDTNTGTCDIPGSLCILKRRGEFLSFGVWTH